MAKSRRALAPLGVAGAGLTVTYGSWSRSPAGTTAILVTSHHQQGLPPGRGDRFAVPALGYEGRDRPSRPEGEHLKGDLECPGALSVGQ